MTKIYCTSNDCKYNEREKEEDVKGICNRETMNYDDICLDEVNKGGEAGLLWKQ